MRRTPSVSFAKVLAALAVLVCGAALAAGCAGEKPGETAINLPPPPPPPPPPGETSKPPAATANPAAPSDPAQAADQEDADVLHIPAAAALFDDFSSGVHHFQLFQRYGSSGKAQLATPPVVRLPEAVALKAAVRFTGENHFLLFQGMPKYDRWNGYNYLVAIVRGGDEIEAELGFCVEQALSIYCCHKFAEEVSSKSWVRIKVPISDFQDSAGRIMPRGEPIKSIAAILDRAPEMQPDPPVDKIYYFAGIFLTP